VLPRRAAVLRRQDPAGPQVALLAVLVDEVEALVEDPELVARADGAGEVDVPGEDVGEVARELGALAEGLHRVVQAGRDDARDARLARLELELVAADHVAVAFQRDGEALHRRRAVAELDHAPSASWVTR
jgi:hypothetical protein